MKNPDITITITGPKMKGKTCLGHALALCLQRGGLHVMQNGCVVTLTDDGQSLESDRPMNATRRQTPFSDAIASQFTNTRRIHIVIKEAN